MADPAWPNWSNEFTADLEDEALAAHRPQLSRRPGPPSQPGPGPARGGTRVRHPDQAGCQRWMGRSRRLSSRRSGRPAPPRQPQAGRAPLVLPLGTGAESGVRFNAPKPRRRQSKPDPRWLSKAEERALIAAVEAADGGGTSRSSGWACTVASASRRCRASTAPTSPSRAKGEMVVGERAATAGREALQDAPACAARAGRRPAIRTRARRPARPAIDPGLRTSPPVPARPPGSGRRRRASRVSRSTRSAIPAPADARDAGVQSRTWPRTSVIPTSRPP